MRVILSILTILSAISFAISEIWVIVSFIIYLVKDEPFNWTVFNVGIISLVVLIVSAFVVSFSKVKDIKTRARFNGTNTGKSKFQQRLEEAQKLQQSKR